MTSLYTFFTIFPDVIARMGKLEQLAVDIHEQFMSNQDSEGPILNLDFLDLVRNSLVSIFQSPDTNLPHLTYLSLVLPSVYDLATVGAALSNHAAARLRHLYLEYTDATGPGGSLEYTNWYWEYDIVDDGSEGHPYSNLQEHYRNNDYMSNLWVFVSRCRNLESLSVAGTQLLDCSAMDWQPEADGLKRVHLSRAAMTYDNVVQLLSPSGRRGSNVVALWLEDVELMDRTWTDVFQYLITCEAIKFLEIWNLNYHRLGESSDFRGHYDGRPWENSAEIWSHNEEDGERLADLVQTVLQRGGKLGRNLEDYDY